MVVWVDSTVALTWIQGSPAQWKEFVANRVAFIQEIEPTARWHHVSGQDNPADCASRGLAPADLANYEFWWKGPAWLSKSSPSWPSNPPHKDSDQDLAEKAVSVHLAAPRKPLYWSLADRYSKFSTLIRITAWILCAVSFMRKRITTFAPRTLTSAELKEAEAFWIKHIQASYFSSEIAFLSCGKSLSNSHPLIRLTPFVDKFGILCLGGRLRNSMLDPDVKHPILLPQNSPLTSLILSDIHMHTLHGGVQIMLAFLRQKFWIGNCKPVSNFVRHCVRCCRFCAVAAQEMMGQLPSSRVTPSRPFFHWSGLRRTIYASHLARPHLQGFPRSIRMLLYIYRSSRACNRLLLSRIYAAYKRFTGRRGLCATLTSDCGTNFVGADAELRRLFAAASTELANITNHLASAGTEWRFHPPAALHFGGKWEATVKSVKYYIRRILGDTIITYEEFCTLLIQIETILNSRPMCPLSDDPSDLNALTPAHFLINGPLHCIPEPSLEDEKTTRLSRWQLLQQFVQRFWRRWSIEYLQRLQEISKWQHPSNQIKLGALVLLMDERYPPTKWPLARIT